MSTNIYTTESIRQQMLHRQRYLLQSRRTMLSHQRQMKHRRDIAVTPYT